MVSVVCVGISVMDHIFKTPELPKTPGKHFAQEYKEIGGGPAATGAAASARLGAETWLWSRVGTDSAGARIAEELAEYGVRVDEIRRVPGAQSSLGMIVVDAEGERMIMSFASPSLDSDPSWLPLARIDGADAVLADVRWQAGSAAALKAARAAGKIALLDADSSDEDITGLIDLSSHAAFSEPALRKYAGCDDLMDALRVATDRVDGWVGVTAGSKGCYWIEDGAVRNQPGFKVQVVDTVGAGDVFHGALAVGLAEAMPIAEAVRFASAAAALKCTKLGGRAGIPTREELDRFLAESP